MTLSSKKRYFPVLLLLTWLIFTVFFFITGPFKYPLENQETLYIYLTLIHLSLFLGYRRGLKSKGRETLNFFTSIQVLKRMITVFFLYTIVKVFLGGGANILSIGSAIGDPAASYLSSHSNENVSIFGYIDMLFAPLQTLGVAGGVYMWNKLSRLYRALLILCIIIAIGNSVAASIRSGIVGMVLTVTSSLILRIVTGDLYLNLKKKIIIFLSVAGFLSLFFMYTAHLSENRNTTIILNPLTLESPEDNNVYFRLFPEDWRLTIIATNFYIGHSYYRLNQAMNLSFNGIGLGFANSYFMIKNVTKITGWNGLESISYGLRLDKEIGYGDFGVFWSTFYTWVAADFTWPGTVVLIFFIGYVFSLSYKDTLKKPNLLAIATFSNSFILIYSFPSVNPFQDGAGITNLFGLFILWATFRFNRERDTGKAQICES
ncbi:hypothetical protein [Desertivirga xinjiangensis]|uniref:hypothetical protein n=1 Tax=Desertivirga xinjiangensis TaxID=539206 RepID=UPI00210CC6FB|nr:hypothetical protein [Pedobacter xinjiangensis]